MRASDKLQRRCELLKKLERVDESLVASVGDGPKNRITACPQTLMSIRNRTCQELLSLDCEPWPSPVDLGESRVS